MKSKHNPKLRKDLTYDEFVQLADRKPDLEGEWIYRLEQTEAGDMPECPYPKFELGMTHTFLFPTLEMAEGFMRSNLHRIRTYRNVITQIPYGKEQWEVGASWLYDHKFDLVDYTITTQQEDKPYNSHFFGRPDYRQRFNEGEIVEVCNGEYVTLALLLSTPPDIARCWSIYRNCVRDIAGWEYHLDYSDDSAIILEGPDYGYHVHLSPLALMRPSLPIPSDIEREIKSWHERSKKAGEDMMREYENHTLQKKMPRGETICDFAPLNLSIHYDKYAMIPHLHIYDGHGLETSLRMDAPEYYDHDGAEGRLSRSQIEALTDFLSGSEAGKSKWWYMIRDWNDDGYGRRLPLDLAMPDYRKLK